MSVDTRFDSDAVSRILKNFMLFMILVTTTLSTIITGTNKKMSIDWTVPIIGVPTPAEAVDRNSIKMMADKKSVLKGNVDIILTKFPLKSSIVYRSTNFLVRGQ
jgi:hypothetical protein